MALRPSLDTLEQRIININEHFTFSLYSNVCRSLFEKHKLMFAFLLCARIMMNQNAIDMVRNICFVLWNVSCIIVNYKSLIFGNESPPF